MEAKLRDEQIEATTLDVHVGALRGGEGVAVRSFEASVRSVLATVLLVKQFPRSLLRLATQLTAADTDSAGVTLGQIVSAPADLDDGATGDAQVHDELLDTPTPVPTWLAQGPPAPPLFTRPASLRASHKAVLLNALSAALLDASVPARGTLVAAHAALLSGQTRTMSTNPSAAEEERAVASFVCAFSFSGHQPEKRTEGGDTNLDDVNDVLTLTDATGSFNDQQVRLPPALAVHLNGILISARSSQLAQAIEACRDVARATYLSIRQSFNA